MLRVCWKVYCNSCETNAWCIFLCKARRCGLHWICLFVKNLKILAHILSSIKPSRVDIIVESAHYIPHLDEKSFLYVLVYARNGKQ